LAKNASGRRTLRSRQMNCLTRRAELGRHPYQVDEGIRFHFLHDLPTVCLHRDLTDSQFSIDTPGLSGLLGSSETGQQRLKNISNNVPLGRLGTPDEIAKAVVFLASEDASFVTGLHVAPS